ncbi:MAG: hypothetical protein GF414_00555 [Candidatus Altiarchaeales archaeon]|nr:hypothetical protein [Candidatus Altiarchaeales archaeon]
MKTVSPDDARGLILSGKAPSGLHVEGYLYLHGCTSINSLPEGLHVGGYLYLVGCTSLKSLPEGMHVRGSLYLFKCTSLKRLPYSIHVGGSILCDPELIENLPYEDLPLYMGLKWDNQKTFDKRLEGAL